MAHRLVGKPDTVARCSPYEVRAITANESEIRLQPLCASLILPVFILGGVTVAIMIAAPFLPMIWFLHTMTEGGLIVTLIQALLILISLMATASWMYVFILEILPRRFRIATVDGEKRVVAMTPIVGLPVSSLHNVREICIYYRWPALGRVIRSKVHMKAVDQQGAMMYIATLRDGVLNARALAGSLSAKCGLRLDDQTL